MIYQSMFNNESHQFNGLSDINNSCDDSWKILWCDGFLRSDKGEEKIELTANKRRINH